VGVIFTTIRGTRCPCDDMPLLIDEGGEGVGCDIEAHTKGIGSIYPYRVL